MGTHASALAVTGIAVVALVAQVVAGTLRARWHLRRLVAEREARPDG